MIRHGKKIQRLQDRILAHGDYRTQLEKACQELEELRHEVKNFLFMVSKPVTNEHLRIPCGNMQKEIEDVKNMVTQLEKMFNRTERQKNRSRVCRRQIVGQMKDYMKERGIK